VITAIAVTLATLTTIAIILFLADWAGDD